MRPGGEPSAISSEGRRGGRPAGPPALVIVAAPLAAHPLIDELFPHALAVVLTRAELRPRRPFHGRLFDVLAEARGRGKAVGLAVPARWLAPPPMPSVFAVADHVNLELRGPLTGAWPAGIERTFPCMTGVYQPRHVRLSNGPAVYSAVTVAGVKQLKSLTSFEREAVASGGFAAAADCLVPPVIVAAYYEIPVAACGIVAAVGAGESEGNQ